MAKRRKKSKKTSRTRATLSKKTKIKKKKPVLHSETKKGILVVVCFSAALISILSFFGGAGIFGQYFLKISQLFFGKGFFLISVGFVLISIAVLIPRFNLSGHGRPVYRTILIGVVFFILSILGIFHIFDLPSGGGYLGLIVGYPLITYLGFWASLVVFLSVLVVSILITFNISIIPSKKKEKEEPIVSEKAGLWTKLKEKAIPKKQDKQVKPEASSTVQGDNLLGGRSFSENKETAPKQGIALSSAVIGKVASDFKLPPLEFLEKDKGQPTSGDIKANINIIKQTLENFGIEVEMAEVSVGPTVTQYTLRPAQGVKLSKIMALQSDLALALAAHPLRIEAPIPSRSLVGIEIPNRVAVIVRLRSLLERPTFKESSSSLIFALGRDVAGNPMFADLSQMPHLLVAGATGTGKTIALNNIIVSLLYNNYPENLKLILIDPKRVELSTYDSIPYLLTPVIVRPDKAIGALRWAVGEMERRFGVLQGVGKRDIEAYNRTVNGKDKKVSSEHLPYIVIIIDELADLMTSHGREVESTIVRLAQMARAVGIHLVVSTQRPSVEIITGLIKANITSRMAFQVASQIDSRTILDMAGAEKLLGNGDMLFLAGNASKARRVQGVYIADREVRKVVDYLKKARQPDYQEEVSASQGVSGQRASFGGLDIEDELCQEAQEVVVQAGKASASLLQRRLRVGYARAARLLDILEEKGIVGPADGARPRDVFIDEGVEEEVD